MSRQYRVSWINGPDGRVIDYAKFGEREKAESFILAAFPYVGDDELLVFEVADSADDSDG